MSTVTIIAGSVGAACLGIVIGGLVYLKKLNKQYDTFAIKLFKQNGSLMGSVEQAGIYKMPMVNTIVFKLRKSKVTLKPDKVPYIMLDNGKKLVFLAKTGVQSYVYGEPSLIKKVISKVTGKEAELKQTGSTDLGFIEPDIEGYENIKITVREEDLDHAKREYVRHTRTYMTNTWKELLPYFIWGITVIGCICLIALLLKDIKVLKDVAISLSEAAKELARANAINAGTIIS